MYRTMRKQAKHKLNLDSRDNFRYKSSVMSVYIYV